MKHYKEFLITAEPFNSDVLSSMLWELDIEGINEDVNCLKVFTSEDSPILKTDIEALLEKLKSEKMLFNYYVEENLQEYRNWNKEWEDNLNIIKVTDNIVIRPSIKEYTPQANEMVITIDPKMSFGTGEHQTTKLMLKMVEKYIKPGMTVLDAGTGTGVLVIAASKLGASYSLGFDIDEWCFENGNENIKLNNVEHNVEIKQAEIKDIEKKEFDIVLANIQKNILLDIVSELKLRIKQDGFLILSGLLFNDEKDIVSKYKEYGLTLVDKLQLDDWISLVFTK
jgi:ribosomal protein L11 methyltransferase